MANMNISKVYLLDVPLESDYKHTLYFTDSASQYNYFKSKIVESYTNVSYQRKDFKIRVPEHVDRLYKCNYVMYQNTHISNKWMYAFIKNMEYISEGCTEIEIETDVIQTWAFDYEIKPSFVEREHVFDDTVGLHTVPEGLETGDYICNEKIEDEKGKDLLICLAISDYANSKYNIKGNLHGGVYSGMSYEAYNTTTEGINYLNERLSDYDTEAKADGINSLFMFPKWIALDDIDTEAGEMTAVTLGPSPNPKTYNITDITKPTTINGYTPKNKKLLCYPYNYLYASNNNGGNAIYHYELFSDEVCNFEVNGVLTPGCSIRMNPLWYKGAVINNDEGLNGGKYPICCWNTDTYTNWLTQNSVNNTLSYVQGAAQVGAGLLMGLGTGGLGWAIGGGSIAGGVTTIANTLAQKHQASMIPDQVKGNTNCGDVITGDKANCFMFYKMSIKKEMAKIIDGFFSMFGYQVNEVKIPNKAHRSRYWYIKTDGINLDGAIPQNDLQKIKNCYDKGITFWRNASEIQNYDLSNDIV